LPGLVSINQQYTAYSLGWYGFGQFGKDFLSLLYPTDFKNGKTLFRHIVITPVIVAPGQKQVIPLPPEFVQAQDGHEKQDCELAAAKRWLINWGPHYTERRVTILGDDLYCHQPYCQAIINQGIDFLLVCKPDSHSLLYEWVADFERIGHVQTLEITRWTGKKRLTESYRFVKQVPLRDSDDALHVNWCEVTIIDDAKKLIYRNAWATTHDITPQNVQIIVAAGRARWKIENENNNILKNHGYHFEHNYSHGNKHLANLLATLNLLAFLLHTALDCLKSGMPIFRHMNSVERENENRQNRLADH